MMVMSAPPPDTPPAAGRRGRGRHGRNALVETLIRVDSDHANIPVDVMSFVRSLAVAVPRILVIRVASGVMIGLILSSTVGVH